MLRWMSFSDAIFNMSLTQKIYLFFSNWFGYKCREGHTNKFLNASEHVLHDDLDADLKGKENK